MREPYETLLGQYREHWFLWKYLQEHEPDFVGIAAADTLGALSSGEFTMCQVALAFWNHDRTARFVEVLLLLDAENRYRVSRALQLTCEV